MCERRWAVRVPSFRYVLDWRFPLFFFSFFSSSVAPWRIDKRRGVRGRRQWVGTHPQAPTVHFTRLQQQRLGTGPSATPGQSSPEGGGTYSPLKLLLQCVLYVISSMHRGYLAYRVEVSRGTVNEKVKCLLLQVWED